MYYTRIKYAKLKNKFGHILQEHDKVKVATFPSYHWTTMSHSNGKVRSTVTKAAHLLEHLNRNANPYRRHRAKLCRK